MGRPLERDDGERLAARDAHEPEPGSAVHAQLLVFARELSALYRQERERSDELRRVLEELQRAYLATMESLALVIEAKDLTTRGHLDRTRSYGLALAHEIEPGLAERPELAYGFFLHDIGKVGVPDPILGKDGPLSGTEWNVMRTHPEVGAQIVRPIPFLAGAVPVILHHHERFDGSGYPDGMRGADIPLEARVFAVADAFDAMTSDRPYRRARPAGRALDEIRAGAGTQFDPEIVDVFVALVERGAVAPAVASA